MGNNSSINELSIGEIEFTNDSSQANISCYLPFATDISVIVQDDVGRSRAENRYSLEEGDQEFSFDISNLSGGNYNAWIDVMGKTFIRNFQIQVKSNNDSWFDSVKSFFG